MRFDIESEEKRQKKKDDSFKKKIYYILFAFFLLVFLILLITYVILSSGSTPKQTVEQPQPVKEIKKTKEKTSEIKIYDENSNERPIAFMIDNNIGDAKHAGLQDSYLNYEIIVEGGLTRIMAIYKDKKVSLIGPIRSARHYFLDYAIENDAIFAHYGWSPQAESDIKKMSITNINGMTDKDPYRRDAKAIAPHNVFTNTTFIKDYIDKKEYSFESTSWKLLNLSASEINLDTDSSAITANNVSMTYSANQYRTYTYDQSNKYYLRNQNGKPHLDRKTSEQLHYKNIIIMKVKNKTIDTAGRQTLENVGTGTGYYITNGYYRKINWSKQTRMAKTNFTYEDGSTVTLNDGNTFIQIVPENSNINIE